MRAVARVRSKIVSRHKGPGVPDFFGGQKRLLKRLVKVITVLEILAPVSFGFGEQIIFHHVKNDLPKILPAMNPPFAQHGQGHRPKLEEREIADASQQFLRGHMAGLGLMLPADFFLGEIQRFPQKKIGRPMIALVVGHDLLQDFFKINGMH